MELEPTQRDARRPTGLSGSARLVIAALAVFGAVTLVQWVLASVLTVVKALLLLVVIVGVGAWVVSTKASR